MLLTYGALCWAFTIYWQFPRMFYCPRIGPWPNVLFWVLTPIVTFNNWVENLNLKVELNSHSIILKHIEVDTFNPIIFGKDLLFFSQPFTITTLTNCKIEYKNGCLIVGAKMIQYLVHVHKVLIYLLTFSLYYYYYYYYLLFSPLFFTTDYVSK